MSTDDTRPLPPLAPGAPAPEAATDAADAPGTTTPTDRAETSDGTAATPVAPGPRRRRVRVGTVVWGVIIAVVGAGILAVAAGYTIDVQLAAIGLLVAAGLGMIVGPLVAAGRRDRR
ncbi:hypothetical protein [Cellulomonas oligotrophica]|uniref:Uncharacterized protein n=1 Tax=Cellulomonas oligotrophica TaxID=931536 RepID=A0A7Y9FED2_9CELL|nr:hypothetical protein [Cellulomonas oligotrophica]NYD85422.1 hypothetical protein [Cellulomonas oligotrophica]GIG31569.1 hypothetical protein Col01nite_07280 [Cellulomonas oligotrophica]